MAEADRFSQDLVCRLLIDTTDGNQDTRSSAAIRGQLSGDLPAAYVGQAYVNKDGIGPEMVRDHKSGAAAIRGADIVALVLEQHREREHGVPVVIDDEDT